MSSRILPLLIGERGQPLVVRSGPCAAAPAPGSVIAGSSSDSPAATRADGVDQVGARGPA